MPDAVTQIKFTIESDIVSVFKARCAGKGVSMTSVIREWMKICDPARVSRVNVSTRLQRRKAVLDIIDMLGSVLNFEEEYRDNIPESFTQRYEAADHACEQLTEAIDCLEDAF